MERAGRLISKMKMNARSVSPEDLARAAWPAAVGKVVAAHTSAAKLVRTSLVVEVEDAIWQKQLNTLRNQILARIQSMVGADVVTEIAFRPMVPKIQPQRAEVAHSGSGSASFELASDDADAIHDAVLRSVYKISRKKATA